uniref:Thioredoxin_14 domain-containing protein n=1 Tax=Macrostomum lignano TaxID=282301 RepID=A0A1I8FTD2_9PLAT
LKLQVAALRPPLRLAADSLVHRLPAGLPGLRCLLTAAPPSSAGESWWRTWSRSTFRLLTRSVRLCTSLRSHQEALLKWLADALHRRGPRGSRLMLLLHIDAHSDMSLPQLDGFPYARLPASWPELGAMVDRNDEFIMVSGDA